MKNTKTTVAGIATIVAAVSGVVLHFTTGTPIDWTAVAVAVSTGIGLITARDHKPTDLTPEQSTTVKQAVGIPVKE